MCLLEDIHPASPIVSIHVILIVTTPESPCMPTAIYPRLSSPKRKSVICDPSDHHIHIIQQTRSLLLDYTILEMHVISTHAVLQYQFAIYFPTSFLLVITE